MGNSGCVKLFVFLMEGSECFNCYHNKLQVEIQYILGSITSICAPKSRHVDIQPGLPVSSCVRNMRSCEFVKFMFRKINDCIWGGNDRLCSLNRGKRVLFTVSAG